MVAFRAHPDAVQILEWYFAAFGRGKTFRGWVREMVETRAEEITDAYDLNVEVPPHADDVTEFRFTTRYEQMKRDNK